MRNSYCFILLADQSLMSQKAIRKIQTSGKYSKVIVLPREFLRKLHWREDQNLEIELDKKKKQLIIRDAKNK